MRTSIAFAGAGAAARTHAATGALLTLITLSPGMLRAQRGSQAAYAALVTTPVGAFAPAANASVGHGTAGTGLLFRVANGDFGGDMTAFGVGFDRRLARGRMTGTLGFGDCDACDGAFIMAGIDAEWQLARSGRALGTNMAIHLRPSFGVSNPADELSFSVALSAPVSILVPATPRFVLLVHPGIGFGHSGDAGKSGVRPLLGGAFAFFLPRRLSLHLGAQHVFIEGGETQFGATVGWHRP